MHFKRLEIIGFKSFLNKTKLKFEPGVTAVVGPNGCGKSNIVDAIKWVLGEQSSKSMRSSSMQDVIFNGTDKYDPVNVAEVSFTLSNEDGALPVDYDEVTINRRIYRSGESEYLLNKTPVRLSDIRSLLMGTGIGTSSYSVVEQGKMDMILSSKPEERRYVFEEASGITRYKTKKREALLKLERTQENLVRINDIIREVERQINSIERQARKAERYKARYDQLKELEVKLACKNFKELNTNDTSLNVRNDGLKQLSKTFSAQQEASNNFLTREKEEFNTCLNELQRLENEVMSLSTIIDKNKHVIDVNNERLQELRRSCDRLSWEIEEQAKQKETLKNRLERMEVRFRETSKKRQEKDSELAANEEKIRSITRDLARYKDQLKIDRENIVETASRQTKTKNSLIKLNADIQNTRARIKRLKIERGNVQAEKEKVAKDLDIQEARTKELEKELENKKAEFYTFNAEYISNQEKLAVLSNQKREQEKRLNEVTMRRQFYQKLLAEREGINEGVKEIMKCVENGDPRFPGVYGILSELINVHNGFGESVESVLGDVAQSLVVRTRLDADRITKCLEENSGGSVNFIILDELRKLVKDRNDSGITKGTLDDITHIISAKEPYSSALCALLRDTFVTVSAEAARFFVEEENDFTGRIVGEKGEVYQKGMHRTRNYSDKETIPLFGRQEKIDRMQKEEFVIAGEIEIVSNDISELETWLKDSLDKKDKLENQLQEKQVEFADVSSKKASVKEKFNLLNDEHLLLDTEIEEEASAAREYEDEIKRLDQLLEDIEKEHISLQEGILEAQKGIQDCNHAKEETFLCISDIKAELSALCKEEENTAENLEREKDVSQRINQEIEVKRKRIDENTERIKTLESQVKVLKEDNLGHNISMEEVSSKKILEKKECKDALAQAIRMEENKIKENGGELEDVKNQIRDLDIKAKELEYKKKALVEKILNLYKVNIAELDIEIDEAAEWPQIARDIDDLKKQLEKMGEVSLGAVEEHKELKERYQFLTTQGDDLTKSKDSLMKAIAKINRTTREIFMSTFQSIRMEFNNYFRMLFSGGKAELILEDESNVLECGIDIVVRPPGKKLANIMQLSGGEKAMTAIALIFAIFKVNPSPFCILDEVDAPLDESNIVRFCRVLQEFIKLSQFVIVTHNRMTIQLADVLYGITMEEKGISKIVSVKFAEEKEVSDTVAVPA